MTPSPGDIRRLLATVLRTDADLDAFCIDSLPNVAFRFTAGMDRVAKVNLLLQLCEPDEVLSKLRTGYPEAVAKERGARAISEPPLIPDHRGSPASFAAHSSIVPAGPTGERRLTIRIQRTSQGLMEVLYLVPVYGQLAATAPFDSAKLGAKIQYQGYSGLEALNRLLDQGSDKDLERFLTGAAVTGEDGVGSLLLRLLFPEFAVQQVVLAHLFGVERAVALSPQRHAVHVRIWTDELALTGVPWRLTAHHGHFLSDVGWTFAATTDPTRKQHVDLPALGRILILVPQVSGLPELSGQAHVEDLRTQLRIAMPQQANDDFFRIVHTRAELERAFEGQSFDVIYYYGHGCVHHGQACLQLGATLSPYDLLTVTALKQMMRDHFPQLLLLNACLNGAVGWHNAGHVFCPEVPVVVCSRTNAFAPLAGALALRWLKGCLTERRDPIEALHQRRPGDPTHSQTDFPSSTHIIYAGYSTWQPAQVLTRRLDPRNPLRLDRTAARAQAAEQVADLVESRSRRVEALLAYAGESNLLDRFSWQAVDHIERRKVAPILQRRVEFPTVRSELRRRLEESLRRSVAEEREPLGHALKRCAPRVRTDGVPVLWLNFGVCGEGKTDRLKPEELRTWLEFSCEYICLHCPDDIRIVSYLALAIEPSKHERLRQDMEQHKYRLSSDQFRAYLLPALPKVEKSEFKAFISDPDNTSCPRNPTLIESATEFIFKDTGDGNYEEIYAHMIWAEQNGWLSLIDKLTLKHGPIVPKAIEEDSY